MGSVPGVRRGVIVLAVAVFVMGWVGVLPTVSAQGGYVAYDRSANTFAVSPTGGDDTANIQAAFDACAPRGPRCVVQLEEGTFHTAQIVVREFRGQFRGMGESRTTIEALPDLAVSQAFPAWILHLPTPEAPWPSLFTFFNGTYSISDMTFLEPYETPTQGYWGNADMRANALFAFISITGLHANTAVDHITMIGAPGDFTSGGPFLFNTINGIFPQALLMTPGGTDFHEVMPLQVTFRATNSAFYTIDNPLAFEDLVDSQITIWGNTFETTEYPVALINLSGSTSVVSQNLARDVFFMAGVLAVQAVPITPLMPCERPSKLFITDNDFQFTNQANALAAEDFGDFSGCERSLDAVVTDNIMYGDETSWPAVVGFWMRSMNVVGNEILGGNGGVYILDGPGIVAENEMRDVNWGAIILDAAAGVLVKGNEIRDSGQWGIALLYGSSNNLIVHNEVKNSGVADLYWDQLGTGNVWMKNECLTSDPPGLCAGH